VVAYRGSILTCRDDPKEARAPGRAVEFYDDGVMVVRDGRIETLGDRLAIAPWLPRDLPVIDHSGRYLVPGFVDAHIHYPQTDIIASYGAELLEWLERYAFPAERAFADPAHAGEVATFFLDQLLANGTTTALVFGTVHKASADAFFAAAQARDLRMIAGKVMMDRHAPDWLSDTPESGYADAKALIDAWHGRGRLGYALTPRFAPTSSPAQLESVARLMREHPGVHVQSHLAENRGEVEWMRQLFPEARSYLDVYERFGLLGPQAVYAHCLHLDDVDRARMAATGTVAAFCPTSNLFLGSGLFDLAAADAHGMRVGMGSDVGGGTSFSMIRTLAEAYKVVKLTGQTLTPWRALYFATLGGARALGLDDRIGSLAPGREADFVVLDPATTPLMARRLARAQSLEERLFALLMLGDDRVVRATYVLGRLAYGTAPAPFVRP